MKWLFAGVGALLVVLLVAAVVLYVSLDGLTRRGIERGTSYATGTTTTLNSAHLGIRQGELKLNALQINNPEGFESPHFLQLGDGDVAVTLRSLLRDQVQVPRLHLSGIDLNIERRDGRNNYDVILEHMEKLQGPPEEQPRDGKKYIINEVVISDVVVKAAVLSLGGEEPRVVTIRLDNIRLTDVGSETEGGVLLEQLSGILINALLQAVVEQAGDALPSLIAGDLRGALAGLGDLGDFDLEKITDNLGGIIGDVTGDAADRDLRQEAEETLRRGVEDNLGGLLNRQRRNGNED
ncbi:AsmA family protein [Phycisphaerales bacterium AB-hyl4]|uniref:AsmA family protein n=1 Tax=Natronomicrosphaera hydrolytica TaxID=3242702 RepID=A0ABV4U9Z1_9BACT